MNNGFLKTVFKNYNFREALRAELEEDIGFFVRYLPGVVGFAARYAAYKCLFERIESFPIIYPGVRFVFMNRIKLGKRVLFNSNTYVYGKGGLEIGDLVLVAPNCSIVAGHHDFQSGGSIMNQPSDGLKLVIERESWIGANSVVLGGITIGQGSVIGAGSVVTKDTLPYSINAGAPAKKVGDRPRS